jgi:succinate dehydrogenase/fumarate reductase flavoprotein subunit
MGGFNAALGNVDSGDNWEVHFKDTVVGGSFLNNQELVEVLTKEAPQQILELERYGACFDRTDDGKILQRIESGATYHKTCMAGDRTGHEMMKTLIGEHMEKAMREEGLNKRLLHVVSLLNMSLK